jgi:hypothetical protein
MPLLHAQQQPLLRMTPATHRLLRLWTSSSDAVAPFVVEMQ